MIRKLGEDKKANWPGHLAEIVQAYNATQSTVMGYSPHYLMFGCRPQLPVNIYFPTFKSTEVPMRGASAKCVDKYMTTVCDWLRAALLEGQAQSMAEAQWQKWYYNQKIGTMELKPGHLVLVKADAFKGKRKIKDRWEDEACEVVLHIATNVHSCKVTDQCGQSHILHWNRLLCITSETGVPLCVGVCQAWDRCTNPTPVKPTPKGSERENTPWVASGLAPTQCQASKTSLGWINGKLQLLLWMSTRASTEDGWRLQVTCSGSGCLQDCMHLAEVVDVSSPSMPLDSGLNDCHDTHRTEPQLQDHRGYGMGKYTSMSSFQWLSIIYIDVEYSHLIEEGPCCQLKSCFIPHSTK